MRRALLLLGLVVVACTSPTPTGSDRTEVGPSLSAPGGSALGVSAPSGTGSVSVVAEYRSVGRFSIGGWAFLVRLADEGHEEQIPFDGPLRLTLPAGRHELLIVTRPMSDAIITVDGETRFTFLEVTASCRVTVDLAPDETVLLRYVAIGGDDCEVQREES